MELNIVEEQISREVEIPERLQEIINKEKVSIKMGKDFEGIKNWLMQK